MSVDSVLFNGYTKYVYCNETCLYEKMLVNCAQASVACKYCSIQVGTSYNCNLDWLINVPYILIVQYEQKRHVKKGERMKVLDE